MADRYEGPATLRTDDGLEVDLAVVLHTTDTDGIYTWDGHGGTHDMMAVHAKGKGGTLVLPDVGGGPVHVPHAEITPGVPGVVVRIHGGGRAPYENS